MRRWSIRLAVLAALAIGCSLAHARSTGPAAGYTGAPALGTIDAEESCTFCHGDFPLNTPGATLEILDVPPYYAPNQVIPLRVRMSSTFGPPRRWGFQLTAVREADGLGAGTFDLNGATNMKIVNGVTGRRYVEHNSAGTFAGIDGPVEWIFNWQAPASHLGRIFFFCAGNAANSDNNSGEDHIYTQQTSIEFDPALVDVPAASGSRDALDAPVPNPFAVSTSLGYALSRGGVAELSVYDASGRRVRELFNGEQPAGRATIAWDGRRDDGALARTGVYFFRLRVAGAQVLTRRVTLAR